MKQVLVFLLLTGFFPSQAAVKPVASISLRPSYGGAVVQGRVTLPKADTLLGVWSSVGAGRLLKCSPRCKVVPNLAFKTANVVGNQTSYRLVLGGQFKAGQKVKVTLRFKNSGSVTVTAPVSR